MNPWEEISLSDYEKHMSLQSVYQLQALNELMKEQIKDCDMESLAILGVAGGNGLEYVEDATVKIVYGIDINQDYIDAVEERYEYLGNKLKCVCIDIVSDNERLPKADYVIANLLLEYVGYEAFIKALQQMQTRYISCVIQVNEGGNWVSDSLYEKSFEGLNEIHHLIMENELKNEMRKHNFGLIKQKEHALPNGKKFVRLDFFKIR